MIEVKNLTKKYGEKTAVDDVSFRIEKGEIVGLMGPNGAGKSTIMKMITGYIMPTDGSIFVDGIDAVENPRDAAERIGFLPELPPLYLEMEVCEYLRFMAEIKGIEKNERVERINEVMEIAQITHVSGRVIAHLSKGYRQRVGLAGALMGMPEVLILDEPTVGLDPRQIADFRNLMIELGKTHTIIFSTHILSEIDMVCDKAIILNEGSIVCVEKMEQLEQQRMGKKEFLLTVDADKESASKVLEKALKASEFAAEKQEDQTVFTIFAEDTRALRKQLFFVFAEAKMPILEMKSTQTSLEEVFLKLTAEAMERKAAQ